MSESWTLCGKLSARLPHVRAIAKGLSHNRSDRRLPHTVDQWPIRHSEAQRARQESILLLLFDIDAQWTTSDLRRLAEEPNKE